MAFYGEQGTRRAATHVKHCIICGDRFTGRGVWCTYHKPSNRKVLYDLQGNPLEDDYPHNHLVRRAGNNALVPRARGVQHIGRLNQNINLPAAAAASLRPFILSKQINRVEYTSDGTLLVEPNNEAVQCPTCLGSFSCHQSLRAHKDENNSGCEKHRMCFPQEEDYDHGMVYRHSQCFVKGCASEYRWEDDWRKSVIMRHVHQKHRYY